MVAKFAHNNFPASHQVAVGKFSSGVCAQWLGRWEPKHYFYNVLRIDFETLCVIHVLVVDVLLHTATEFDVCYQ